MTGRSEMEKHVNMEQPQGYVCIVVAGRVKGPVTRHQVWSVTHMECHIAVTHTPRWTHPLVRSQETDFQRLVTANHTHTRWSVMGPLKGKYYTTRCERDSPLHAVFKNVPLLTSQVGVSTGGRV